MTDIHEAYNVHEHHPDEGGSHPKYIIILAIIAVIILLVLASLTFAVTLTALAIVAPSLLIVTPVLVIATVTLFLLGIGFLASVVFVVLAVLIIWWIYKYTSDGHHHPGAELVDQVKDKLG
ncbi:hypothetical protein QVD17_31173 [Tagetes erecta]|uniref:Oleosin n=1 Tax=Tagetes erecta TaxID=13708 RepID=A0AAD8K703_TARER|nr:hypothetical protein QVD17_31173 [Tagetes erecta]